MSGPPDSWPSPEMRDIHVVQEAILEHSSKSVERLFVKQVPKTNGVREEHNHRGTGYISITGHRAGEAAIAYEYGADVEALMPKLRHSDYFTEPRIQELAAKERAEPGYCRRVVNFVVGRKVVCILLSELLTGILPQVR
jgi:nuclear pore complex protein Nup98-Nup96